MIETGIESPLFNALGREAQPLFERPWRHPPAEVLADYAHGTLSPDDAAELRRHAFVCDDCAVWLNQIVAFEDDA